MLCVNFCTDAVAAWSFLWRPVFTCMWCSLTVCRFAQTLSSRFPGRRSIRLLCSLPALPSVEAYRMRGAVHARSTVDTNDSRRLAKQPVKCLNISLGRPTSCLYSLGAPFIKAQL